MAIKRAEEQGAVTSVLPYDIDEEELAANVLAKDSWYEQQVRRTKRQWLINAAFTRGQQFSMLHRNEDRLVTLQEPPGRKQIMDDMIGPWKDHIIANIVKATPTFEAIPVNYDNEAVSAARFATALLTHYWDSWQFTIQFVKLASYLIDFGNAFIFLNYETRDPVPKMLKDTETGEHIYGADGFPVIEKQAIADIWAEVLMPHNVKCELSQSPIDEKPWVIIEQRRSPEYFMERYGEEVPPDVEDVRSQYNLSRISSNVKNSYYGSDLDYATEYIYMQKPCPSNPEGMIGSVTASGKTMFRDVWPYERLVTYPLEQFHYTQESGEFHARSRVERQIPIQKSINLITSIIAENAEQMGHMKWVLAEESGVQTPTNYNEVLRYAGGPQFKPDIIQGNIVAGDLVNAIGSLKNSMRDIQNYHGASLGSSVSGVRSDLHAQNLQDQDLLPLTTLDVILGERFRSLAEKVLMIAGEKITEERLISYVGKDNKISYLSFKGAMLGETRKVKVRLDNVWKRNKNAVIQNIIQYYQVGMITDKYKQPDGQEALRLLEFSLPDSVFKKQKLHGQLAEQENERMLRGEQAFVLPWQDHDLHMSIHEDFMNGATFNDLIEAAQKGDKQAGTIVETVITHYKLTQQAWAETIQMITPKDQERTEQEGTKKKSE